jgi:hypothetical protein
MLRLQPPFYLHTPTTIWRTRLPLCRCWPQVYHLPMLQTVFESTQFAASIDIVTECKNIDFVLSFRAVDRPDNLPATLHTTRVSLKCDTPQRLPERH